MTETDWLLALARAALVDESKQTRIQWRDRARAADDLLLSADKNLVTCFRIGRAGNVGRAATSKTFGRFWNSDAGLIRGLLENVTDAAPARA